MTALADTVHVGRRFQRSIRIDTDLGDPKALDGFICPRSSADVLLTMARHVAETGQGAFTWTGPYGGGKSCAALLVANLVAGNKKQRSLAEGIVGPELAEQFSSAFPGRGRAWDVLALTGRRTSLAVALAEAGFWPVTSRPSTTV